MMMAGGLARVGTIKAAARKRTPASLAYAAALKLKTGQHKPGRFPVADRDARTVEGICFDSAKEAARFAELRLLERAGKITELKHQVVLAVLIGQHPYTRFTVDFTYRELPSYTPVFEEVKSSGSAKDTAYRLRRKAAELFHGIRIVEHVR